LCVFLSKYYFFAQFFVTVISLCLNGSDNMRLAVLCRFVVPGTVGFDAPWHHPAVRPSSSWHRRHDAAAIFRRAAQAKRRQLPS